MYYPKLSKKPRKDCITCKALINDKWCGLNFKTKQDDLIPNNNSYAGLTKTVPLESCPKPLTFEQFIICKEVFEGNAIK